MKLCEKDSCRINREQKEEQEHEEELEKFGVYYTPDPYEHLLRLVRQLHDRLILWKTSLELGEDWITFIKNLDLFIDLSKKIEDEVVNNGGAS